jgi:hypothetical protein
MAFKATVLRILIASPSDVLAERRRITQTIYSWNGVSSADLGVVVLPVLWETHASPELGARPQAILNRQIVDRCDILVGFFSSRFGTRTGVAESGTLEEIERMSRMGKPIMLYFSSRPLEREDFDPEQYLKVQKLKEQFQKQGLIDHYTSISELSNKFSVHLTRTVKKLVGPPVRAKSLNDGLSCLSACRLGYGLIELGKVSLGYKLNEEFIAGKLPKDKSEVHNLDPKEMHEQTERLLRMFAVTKARVQNLCKSLNVSWLQDISVENYDHDEVFGYYGTRYWVNLKIDPLPGTQLEVMDSEIYTSYRIGLAVGLLCIVHLLDYVSYVRRYPSSAAESLQSARNAFDNLKRLWLELFHGDSDVLQALDVLMESVVNARDPMMNILGWTTELNRLGDELIAEFGRLSRPS